MPGSSYGTMFRITTWGESHGKGIGVVVDGCPAGLPLCEEDIQTYLNRRKPGQSKYTTARQEDDAVEILPEITTRLLPSIAPVTQTMFLIKSMGSGTIAEAAGLPAGRQSAG